MGKRMLAVLAACAALGAAAEASISHIVVNQRWPWSEKVDVDFVLSGETNDVEATATWDAHPAPYRLGTLFGAAPGQNRITWDPSASEFRGQTLTGFTVALSNSAASAHNYIVVDLVNGGYEFLADVPAGGWTDEHKSSKMVFRRIPAGTYTLGEEYATFTNLGYTVSQANTYCQIQNRRAVTFTSDFYVGVFKYTEAQHDCLASGTPGSSFKPKKLSYNGLRGEVPAVDWPATGYGVAPDSIVAKLRAKAGAALMVDLCEEEQWEVAARAGTGTFWPTGGAADEAYSVHTNQVNSFASWYGNDGAAEMPVGTKGDNGWGLYDVVGLAGEWTLDTAVNNRSLPKYGLPTSVDPVGATREDSWAGYRVLRGTSGNSSAVMFCELLPCRRQMAAPGSEYATRFCIHLKPLTGEGWLR